MRGRWPAPGRCSIGSTSLFHTPATHAHILTSLLQLIEERHARFNATLYQLEPDVKEAPGALRDLAATRTIALLTDPLLLRRGPADPARFDDAEDFLLRVRSALHLEAGPQPERAQPRAAGADRRICSATRAPSRGSASSG